LLQWKTLHASFADFLLSTLMKTYQHIIFDLDGTLSDPREGIFNGLRHALRAMGENISDDHDFTYVIGPPIHDALYMYHFTDMEKVKAAVQLFREYYSVKGLFENQMYEGIDDLLRSLRMKGAHLYVATNKPQPFAERILKHFGIYDHFTGVYGVDITREKVSKEELVARLIDGHAVDVSAAVLVGDTKYDILAARAYGIDAAAVGYGFGRRQELEEMKPVIIIETVSDLFSFFLPAA
jgi:phosphoglycolate phosphatase